MVKPGFFHIRGYIAWMAWRNLISRKRRSGLSFMTMISIAGVAIGVATLIIVLSVMGGFEDDLEKKMLRGEPHMELQGKSAAVGFSAREIPVKKLAALVPEATAVEPFVKVDVVLKHGKHLQHAELIGVDPAVGNHLWIFGDSMIDGNLKSLGKKRKPIISESRSDEELPGIVLGELLAGNLGVDIGDEVTIINPQAAADSNSALAQVTSIRHYTLVGIFRSGAFDFDGKWSVVSLTEARKFMTDYDESLDDDEFITGVAFKVKDPYAVDELEGRFKQFKDLQVLTWKKANKSLLFALKLEKFAMGSILMLIVVVAAFSISGTMMMTVFHKRMQVSLLRSVGMTRMEVANLFLAHGMAIGTVGILLGLVAGVGVCFLIQNFKFIDLPPGVYYIKELPVKFLPPVYLIICIFAWVFSILASLYPALTAAKQSPSYGLRVE
jgi:lipoprotein-releasing system permease protein